MKQEEIFNDEYEQNINDSSLNFNEITNNPIVNFYDKLTFEIDNYINEFFDNYLHEINEFSNKIDNFQSIIETKNQAIYEVGLKNKINNKKITNIFIGLGFVVFIGFFFLKTFKRNRKDIIEFKKYRKQQNNEINKLKDQKENLTKILFSFFDYDLAINSILKKMGLKPKDIFDDTLISDLSNIFLTSNEEDIVAIKSYLSFKFKNTPIYDLSFYKRAFRDVVTSRTVSFPYNDTETYVNSNGTTEFRNVTKYEYLTAYHKEYTPFLDENNYLILKTNFLKELNFTTFKKGKKFIEFENKDFSKKYKVTFFDDKSKVNSDILQYFTIKAQEDYLDFYSKFDGNVPQIAKYGNSIIVPSRCDDVFGNLKNKINYLYKVNFNDEINVSISKLKEDIHHYLFNLIKRTTACIISPVINREWYNNKNEYRIGNSKFEDETTNKINLNYLLTLLNREEYFSFSQHTPSRPPWLQVMSLNKSNNINFMKIKKCSYYHEDLIDCVQVCGVHVGIKTIAVPYKRFYYFEENKNLIHIENTSNSKLIDFVISNKMKSSPYSFMAKYHEEIMKYDYLKELLIQNSCDMLNLWVNKNINFNNLEYDNQKYFNIVRKIYALCDNKCSIHCNKMGISICIDDIQYDQTLLNDIIYMCKQLFSVFSVDKTNIY